MKKQFLSCCFLLLGAVGANAQSLTVGWNQIPDTTPNATLSAVCDDNSPVRGWNGCASVIATWNGGIADTARNRFIVWGGGHENYWGNEVYALNINPANPL